MSKQEITPVVVVAAPEEEPSTFASRAKMTPADVTAGYMQNVRLSTKEALDLQPKHQIRLTAAKKGEPNYEVVGVNGYNFQIKRGENVEVPQTVYDLLVGAELI